MARSRLQPIREAGAALAEEVQQRLGEARDQGKSAAEHVVAAVKREVTEPLAARSAATKGDLARLEARVAKLERALAKAGTPGAKKSGGVKKAGSKSAAKKATTSRSSR